MLFINLKVWKDFYDIVTFFTVTGGLGMKMYKHACCFSGSVSISEMVLLINHARLCGKGNIIQSLCAVYRVNSTDPGGGGGELE